jgi:diaminopimelate epimerase
MDFVKMQGAGNDFIVIEGPYAPDAEDVVAWCGRRTGIGADGVLVVTALSSDRISMRYWNADGGEAEMCGNGLRCVARYAFDRDWVDGAEFVVESAVGDHPVTVKADSVVAFVGEPAPFRTGTLTISGHEVHPFAIGNPHAVLFVADVGEAPVTEVGPIIEHDALFPNRTNVEFVEVLDEGGVRARVWERGVGETQASGTGATASAYIAHTIRDVPIPVEVSLPGGTISVWFNEEGAWMEGSAEYSFSGSVD